MTSLGSKGQSNGCCCGLRRRSQGYRAGWIVCSDRQQVRPLIRAGRLRITDSLVVADNDDVGDCARVIKLRATAGNLLFLLFFMAPAYSNPSLDLDAFGSWWR